MFVKTSALFRVAKVKLGARGPFGLTFRFSALLPSNANVFRRMADVAARRLVFLSDERYLVQTNNSSAVVACLVWYLSSPAHLSV